MNSEIVDGLVEALHLLFAGSPIVNDIAVRSIYISGLATVLAVAWGIPLAMLISFKQFTGKNIVKGVFNIGLGLPAVTLGLVLYLLFSKSGPLSVFGLLYTPTGIIIGEAILVTPVMVSFSVSALEAVDPGIRELAKTLGASDMQASITILSEGVKGVTLAVAGSFNRAISELSVALMIGGNIKGLTRVLTTTIALETSRGETALSIAIAIILMLIVAVVNAAVYLVKRLWLGSK